MSTPTAPPKINFPAVTKDTVINFGHAWDLNGIKMILDSTSIQFAMDFANVCLRSYVLDLINKANAQKQTQKPNEGAAPKPNVPTPPPAPAKPKSSIILTDGD